MDIISNSDYILTLISNTKDIKRNLNNSIYSELHINYNQGNRDGDYILKEKVEYINIEVEQYYSTIELFENARVADSKQFYQEILSFFKTHYLEEFLLQDKLHNLSSELSKQDLQDIEFNRKNQDSSYHRNPKNIIREELKKELEIFEKAFNQDVIPKLLSFLSLVNILYFYEVLKELITRSILDDKRLFLNELPSYLKSYIDNEIKISKINYSAEDISQHITKKIKEFKFIDLLEKNNLTNTHELSLLIHDFANKNFKQKKRSASETNTIAQQQNEKELIYNEIFSLLECLCIKGFGTKSKKIHELTLMKPYRKFVDLKNNKKMRFLFHVPSKSHKSLLDISEKLVDFLIFYNEFFLKEFKKPYPLNLFSPLVATIVYQREFVSIWKIALEVSSIESNQRQTILNKVEKFIHNDNANDLINSINLVCKNLTIGINKLDMHLQTVNNSKLSSLENKLQIVKDESYILQMFQNDLIKIKV